jgi:peptidoglycan/LPS O-acetylase OafA/YrhL
MTAPPAARYRPLGAFRFGLAVLVVLQHFQHLLPPERRAVFSHMGFGAMAVAVFFAVSGFVVAEANATFYAGRPGAFLANRAVRLVPPYFAALALSVIVQAILWRAGRLILWDFTLAGSPLAPARLLTGLLGLVPGFNPRWLGQDFEFIPFVWTLRLEVAFYLIAAATMLACTRQRSSRPVEIAICGGLALSTVFLVVARRTGILGTIPMFLVGSLLFLLERRPVLSRAVVLALTVAIAAVGFASWRQHGAPVLAWQMSVLGVLLALFAWLAISAAGGVARRWDKRLGEMSYPLYLNHYVVGILATTLTPGWLVYAGSVLAAVALSTAAGWLVDRRLGNLRNQIRQVKL